MSYQVLARKWRPSTFHQLVGQDHVLKALVNALDSNRLHHAYLFTGTRGVGKTSIARLFAKSLNCEQGVSASPCGECSACREIAEGRFVDLIEVDAASRTKVEDTRELMENVQYAPTQGRYKVYLIDEVHMLSTHSFNALLKTLEEPPPHIKFLLATTDPQKLPVTILSRCLQFNLKNMIPERIVEHLRQVLEAESVRFEEPALWLLARAANGSMRDAMSLTDQAIAYGSGALIEADVRAMLGTVDQRQVLGLLERLAEHDAAGVIGGVAALAEFGVDFDGVLAELLGLLHRVALAQMLPDSVDNSLGDRETVLDLARRMRAEDVQLYYQIALGGRKELPLVPVPREGLEMTLLRMLAFRPVNAGEVALPQGQATGHPERQADGTAAAMQPEPEAVDVTTAMSAPAPVAPSAPAQAPAPTQAPTQAPAPVAAAPEPQPEPPEPAPAGEIPPSAPSAAEPVAAPAFSEAYAAEPPPAEDPPPWGEPVAPATPASPPAAEPPPKKPEPLGSTQAVATPGLVKTAAPGSLAELDGPGWIAVLEAIGLTGMTYNIAANAALEGVSGNRLEFLLSSQQMHLFNDTHRQRMEQALSTYFDTPVQVQISEGQGRDETPAQYRERRRRERHAEAVAALENDPNVRAVIANFDARLEPESIKPVDPDNNEV
ncbi:DNA polymerase III subunit gamma/tau [Motiliproteus sp. SC1-56]|uniref:DNA polymerase III subunit gamma/tau n=1 Tax=Motiliproteus sp. SC1-56 TaxID=2799565 RepID=UPI001A90C59C|nr:DNA polymerase III subunit gamma/tau [Motiliproteus sp. SC1-56]